MEIMKAKYDANTRDGYLFRDYGMSEWEVFDDYGKSVWIGNNKLTIRLNLDETTSLVRALKKGYINKI